MKVISFVLFLNLILANPAKAENRVKGVKFGVHPNFSRVVFSLEEKAPYKLISKMEEGVLILEISKVSGFNVPEESRGTKYHLVDKVLFTQSSPELVKAEIRLRDKGLEFNQWVMEEPPLIVIDFRRPSHKEESEEKPAAQKDKNVAEPTPTKLDVVQPEETTHEKQAVPFSDRIAQKGPIFEYQDLTKWLEIDDKEEGAVILKEALRHFNADDYSDALQRLNSLEEQFPQSKASEMGLYLQGEIHLRRKDVSPKQRYQNAIKAFKYALTKFPTSEESFWALLQLANSYQNLELYFEADLSYEKYLNAYPNSPYIEYAYLGKAQVKFHLGDIKQAKENFLAVIKNSQSPLLVSALLGMGDCFYKEGDYSSAKTNYEKVLESSPNFLKIQPQTIFNMGETYFQLRDFPRARKIFFKLFNLYPQWKLSDEALARIGDSYYQQGNSQEAIKIYSIVASEYPHREGGLISQINLYSFQGKDLETLRVYYENEEFFMEGVSSSILWKLAESHRRLGLYDEALNLYKRIFQMEKELLDQAALQAGNILLSQERYAEAEAILKEFVANNASNPFYGKALQTLAECLFLQNKFHEAVATYSQLLQQPFSDLGRIHYKIGDSYHRMGLFPMAADFFLKAVQSSYLTEDLIKECYIKIGDSLYKIGKYPLALEAYLKSSKFKVQSSKVQGSISNVKDSTLNVEHRTLNENWVLYQMGRCYKKLGNYQEGLKAFKELESSKEVFWSKLAKEEMESP